MLVSGREKTGTHARRSELAEDEVMAAAQLSELLVQQQAKQVTCMIPTGALPGFGAA